MRRASAFPMSRRKSCRSSTSRRSAEVENAVGAPVDPLRFRGNVYVSGWPAWREFDLLGQEIALGGARLKVVKRIVRCAATNVDPQTAVRDLAIPQRCCNVSATPIAGCTPRSWGGRHREWRCGHSNCTDVYHRSSPRKRAIHNPFRCDYVDGFSKSSRARRMPRFRGTTARRNCYFRLSRNTACSPSRFQNHHGALKRSGRPHGSSATDFSILTPATSQSWRKSLMLQK